MSRRTLVGRRVRRTVLGIVVGAVLVAVLAVSTGRPPASPDRIASRPDLRPTPLTVTSGSGATHGRLILVAPFRGDYQRGPMILDGRGRLLWFHPVPDGERAMNFQVQRYQGRPVLTWWQGTMDENGRGRGEYVIADEHYHEIARFRAAGGRPGDFHEFQVTPRGTALITRFRSMRRDLTSLGGGKHAHVLGSEVQEIDIATGRLLFRWRAIDHVPLSDSHEALPNHSDKVFDYFHANSVDVDHDGNLLVSSRHTDTIYKIDRRTGRIIWRLGGPHSDFDLGPGAGFSSQHDARRQPDGTISLFDNANPPKRQPHSRAMVLRLDKKAMTATLQEAVTQPLGVSSKSQGNTQVLPNGGLFVGWGKQPYVTEYDPDGHVVFDAHFPEGVENYRAFLEHWDGRPTTRPAIATRLDPGGGLRVDASWNGATEVGSWTVLSGLRPDALRRVGTAPWRGFDTAMTVRTYDTYVAVEALDRSGRVLGRSRVVRAASSAS